MFDGLDELVLPAGDIEPLRRLYVDLFQFTEIADDASPDPALQQLWGLPAAPSHTVLLGKPKSNGGWIRLVQVPGLPLPSPAGRPDRTGAYALDFYLRDAATVEDRILSGGWRFITPAVHYQLPGTDIPVRERMLIQSTSGLLHACVQYRPRGTRCVLDADLQEDTSEVVAAVFVTDDFAAANDFARDVLGATCYFEGRFGGREVEQMLALEPGEGFRAALFRGPRSRNARLEFAEIMTGHRREPEVVPRVIAGCVVPDLDALHEQLRSGEHGDLLGRVEVNGVPHLGFDSRYGARFDFVSPPT